MDRWFAELFRILAGTPQRFFRTIVVGAILLMILSGDFRSWVISQTLGLISAVLPSALILGIIVWAFRIMLGPLFPGRRR